MQHSHAMKMFRSRLAAQIQWDKWHWRHGHLWKALPLKCHMLQSILGKLKADWPDLCKLRACLHWKSLSFQNNHNAQWLQEKFNPAISGKENVIKQLINFILKQVFGYSIIIFSICFGCQFAHFREANAGSPFIFHRSLWRQGNRLFVFYAGSAVTARTVQIALRLLTFLLFYITIFARFSPIFASWFQSSV